ncbi:MAG TPA: tetratricopeptide repeat protein [Phycisphaerae bacterium]|nr:tetratricopeptide repeat protein [Phycisphaerae bacterium]
MGAPVLVGAVVVAYIPAIQGGYIWDDDDYVTENVHLHSLPGLGRIWFDVGATHQYYPLVHTSFWIEYHLWRLDPLGYHLVNVLLHALGAVLLWLVLRRLALPGAWLAAAVFALHPMHVESVAWITERKNVLSAVCYFAALLAWLRFSGLDGDRPAEPRRRRYYAVALLLFCCALLSKTVTCSLPAAVVLLLWWKRPRLKSGDLLPLAPMFALGIAAGLLTAWMEKHSVGAQGMEWSLTAVERCLVAGRVIWFYLAKLIWPAGLTFIYPRWHIDAGMWWQYAYPLAAVAVPIALWMLRRRVGKGTLVAALFFGGTLFPALGFVDVYPMRFSFVADHFAYLASIGPIALFAALLTIGLRRGRGPTVKHKTGASPTAPHPVIGKLIPAALLVLLAVLTWRQGTVYQDAETLWRDALARNPSAWMAHNNLGNLLKDRGDTEQAMEHYRAALELKPDFIDALNNLGAALVKVGRFDEALARYDEALRLRPNRATIHFNVGEALAKRGDPDAAIAAYQRALQLDPELPAAHNAMGIALAGKGLIDQAIQHYQRALQLNPDHAEAHNNLAVALAMRNRLDEALSHFREAVRLKPDFAEAVGGLGLALATRGDVSGAIAQWRQALRIQPANTTVRCLLADHLLQQGRAKEAAAQYQEALRIDPNCIEAQRGLAAVRQRQDNQ